MQRVSSVIFYKIEKAIKLYRQLAHQRLKKAGLKITVDQWLTLSSLQDSPFLSQKEIAAILFKDEASITRIITLLEKAGFLKRNEHSSDQRRSSYSLTPNGKKILKKAMTIVKKYRADALEGITAAEFVTAENVLQQMILNCDEKLHK
jgi:MarR family transcriptional regulator for hemolysin